MKVLEAQIQISAMDKTGAAFDAIARKSKELDKAIKDLHDRYINESSPHGRPSTQGSLTAPVEQGGYGLTGPKIAAGLAVAGVAAVNAEQKFAALDRRMTLLGITAEATDAQTASMLQRAKDVSMKYAMPTEGTVGAMEDLAAQGKHYQEIMDQIDPIVKTAAVSGADPLDIAKTAMTLTDSFKIPIKELPKAFDTLYAGGLMGKFELKDMARELPSLGPMASVRGFQGLEGLQKFVAYLETLRAGTADGSTAANQMLNILQKLDSQETNNKFKKSEAEIDNAGSLDLARKSGGDQIATVLANLDKVTKGDASKINTIFGDLQVLQGATTLTTMKSLFNDYLKQLGGASGGVDKNLPKVTGDAAAANTRLANTGESAWVKAGQWIWSVIGPGIEAERRRSSQSPEALRGSAAYMPGAQDPARRQVALDAYYDRQINDLTARKAQYEANARYFQGLTANDGFMSKGFHQAAADDATKSAGSLAAQIVDLLQQKAKARSDLAAEGQGAKPSAPVDVTGKVQLDPASKASVEVRVKVDGPGTVTGMSASGGGNLKANVGVSMAPAHTSRRDE